MPVWLNINCTLSVVYDCSLFDYKMDREKANIPTFIL